MSDDLAALFAKKAQKRNKKKNVVNLDEVGQQLERKARIQETGELDMDENEGKDAKLNESSKVTPSAEDSEWIEHTEKPSLVGLTFKEFTENPDELLEEGKKRANNESAKTWQIREDVPVEAPKSMPPRAYQAPQARRELHLDIKSEEMFPSIAAADVIAEKLKVEEKKKITTPIVPPEEQFQEAKKNVYRPPRATDQLSSGARSGPTSGGGYRSSDGLSRFGGGRPPLDSSTSEKPEERNRRIVNVMSNPFSNRGGLSSTPVSSQDDGTSNWRSVPRVTPVNPPRSSDFPRSTDTTASSVDGGWRSSKPAAVPETPATSGTTPAGSGKYVPPRMRGKT